VPLGRLQQLHAVIERLDHVQAMDVGPCHELGQLQPALDQGNGIYIRTFGEGTGLFATINSATAPGAFTSTDGYIKSYMLRLYVNQHK
jgi:hypothetical protein